MAGTAVYLVLNSGAATQTTSRIVGTRGVTAAGAVTVATTDDIVIINKTVGAAKTQKYGVRSLGTSDAVKLVGNTLTGNLTADFLLVGSANRVAIDTAVATVATIPANFTADRILTFVQPDGSIAYIPARLGAW